MATRQIKTTNYFSHDSNARNDEKLIRLRMRHGAAGYGVYFMMLERLREETDYMSVKDYNMIAFDLRVDAALIKSVVEDFGLFAFTENGKCFYSESFLKRMKAKDVVAETRKNSALARWKKESNKSTDDANAMQMQCKCIENAMQQSKESKESKERNISSTKRARENASNNAFLKKFFQKSNQANIDVLLMNYGMKTDEMQELRKLAEEVVAEWNISQKEHNDYTDWSQHLIAAMRFKVKDKQRTKGKNVNNDNKPPANEDYLYDGGFGSKDV